MYFTPPGLIAVERGSPLASHPTSRLEIPGRRAGGLRRRPYVVAPVTFRDVAAYFSEEEWKLLRNWQKELYKNVMKEIQQAFISLGPRIAASVFSLRAKEKEDIFQVDSEKRHGADPSPGPRIGSSGFLPKTKEKEELAPVDSERTNTTGHPLSGVGNNSDLLFRKKVAKVPNVKLLPASDRREGNDFNTVFSMTKCKKSLEVEKELENTFVDHSEGHSNPGPHSAVVSFRIKEEGDMNPVDFQSTERRDIINCSRDPSSRKRRFRTGELDDWRWQIGLQKMLLTSSGRSTPKRSRNRRKPF
ncbi:hypothetical protein NDU88_006418 [Pleurodeles waltl]|uniref:KRAB domain-containing protein n=1 Tax=Pleurodeles waltl TaxID=8319 RepID=A0AAV7RLJ3_PLEWA|nr:hypothetical protein NDU88_006418 [Pleurodeles waltl]